MIGVGSQLGNYVVRKQVGEGGMGMVFLAEHPQLGRMAAVKVIHPDLAKDRDAVSRFFTEAQAVNKIRHPNIVDITDYGQSPEGDSYFVMEYLDGESLAARMRRGPLTIPEVQHIGAQIADALAASHRAGILHRDLKPDNAYLIERGDDAAFVKVLDFGLAKLVGGPDGEAKALHKTKTGTVMGTAYYMAPEQCAGKPDIDARADIYAFGVILFEMIAGRVPFSGQSFGELIVKHVTEAPPPLTTLAPHCPPWLSQLVLAMLAKDKAQRPGSMAEVRDALRQRTRGAGRASVGALDPTVPPSQAHGAAALQSTMRGAAGQSVPGPPRSRTGLVAAIAGVAIAAGALITFFATRGSPRPRPSQPAVAVPTPEPVPVAVVDAGALAKYAVVISASGGTDAENLLHQATLGEIVAKLGPDFVVSTDGTLRPGQKRLAINWAIATSEGQKQVACSSRYEIQNIPGGTLDATVHEAGPGARADCLRSLRKNWIETAAPYILDRKDDIDVGRPSPPLPPPPIPGERASKSKQRSGASGSSSGGATTPTTTRCDEVACVVSPDMPCCAKFKR